jgi:hypothetical protein
MLINYQSQPKNDRTGIEDTDVTPKRILMSADTVGGVWTYALELARGLLPYGVEVALATMGTPLTPEQWKAAKSIPNWRCLRVTSSWNGWKTLGKMFAYQASGCSIWKNASSLMWYI